MSIGIASAVSAIAVAAPEALAVRTATEDVSFGELVRRAATITSQLEDSERDQSVLVAVRDAVDVAVMVLGVAASRRNAVVASAGSPPAALEGLARAAGATDVVAPPPIARAVRLPSWSERAASIPFAPRTRSPDDILVSVGTSGSTGAPRFIGLMEGRFASGVASGSVLRDIGPGSRIGTTFSTAARSSRRTSRSRGASGRAERSA